MWRKPFKLPIVKPLVEIARTRHPKLKKYVKESQRIQKKSKLRQLLLPHSCLSVSVIIIIIIVLISDIITKKGVIDISQHRSISITAESWRGSGWIARILQKLPLCQQL